MKNNLTGEMLRAIYLMFYLVHKWTAGISVKSLNSVKGGIGKVMPRVFQNTRVTEINAQP
jgi:hypothetical protein